MQKKYEAKIYHIKHKPSERVVRIEFNQEDIDVVANMLHAAGFVVLENVPGG